MRQRASSKPLLDTVRAAFIQGAVSIIAAAPGPENRPAMARAIGCRVSADAARIRVFLAASQSRPLIAAIEASGALAVVFSEPSSHRTLQLKGRGAVLEKTVPGDAQQVAKYVQAFADEVRPLGHDEAFVRAMFWFEPDDLACVAFIPESAFDQTPGPRAGAAVA